MEEEDDDEEGLEDPDLVMESEGDCESKSSDGDLEDGKREEDDYDDSDEEDAIMALYQRAKAKFQSKWDKIKRRMRLFKDLESGGEKIARKISIGEQPGTSGYRQHNIGGEGTTSETPSETQGRTITSVTKERTGGKPDLCLDPERSYGRIDAPSPKRVGPYATERDRPGTKLQSPRQERLSRKEDETQLSFGQLMKKRLLTKRKAQDRNAARALATTAKPTMTMTAEASGDAPASKTGKLLNHDQLDELPLLDLSDLDDDHFLELHTLAEVQGLKKVKDFLELEPRELSRISDGLREDLFNCIAKKGVVTFHSPAQLEREYQKRSVLSTGYEWMDEWLGGDGLRAGGLLQIAGQNGSGKTTFLQKMVVTTALAGKDVYVIDTERKWDMNDLFKSLNIDEMDDGRLEEIQNKIHIGIPNNMQQLIVMLKELVERLKAGERFSLLSIDSLSSLPRGTFCGKKNLGERCDAFNVLVRLMSTIGTCNFSKNSADFICMAFVSQVSQSFALTGALLNAMGGHHLQHSKNGTIFFSVLPKHEGRNFIKVALSHKSGVSDRDRL